MESSIITIGLTITLIYLLVSETKLEESLRSVGNVMFWILWTALWMLLTIITVGSK